MPAPGVAIRWCSCCLALVDDLRASQPIDTQRICVVGFSMRASAAGNALTLRPGFFAGAVPIAGVPPERTAAAVLANTPMLVMHGSADTENPIGPDLATYRAIASAGSTHIRARRRPWG